MRYRPCRMENKNSGKIQEIEQTKYCLYARKSTESDERQAMSIDSQIKEMESMAKRENLFIKEIRQESHSAKASGLRPVFNQLLTDIREEKFNGILTWAPDRLSRNAGDLGTLVDLMDQGKLKTIKTFSQSFSNNPNEKFLLMILCSQAKLENDQKGINVKRGLRAKCEAGWRPGNAPIGYVNRLSNNRIAHIEIDKKRGPVIKEMFHRVAEQGHSGRTIKYWLDKKGFETKVGKKMVLAEIYRVLKNPFYYGEFEFGGKHYQGKHKPLITKQIFDKVQVQLTVVPKKWNKQVFPFKSLFTCGQCGGGVTAEEKYKKLLNGKVKRYVYYHCARSVDYDCDQPYITEEDLVKQILAKIDEIEFDQEGVSKKLKNEIAHYHRLRADVLHQEILDRQLKTFDYPLIEEKSDNEKLKDYIVHVLKTGFSEERQDIINLFKTKFILKDKQIFKSPEPENNSGD